MEPRVIFSDFILKDSVRPSILVGKERVSFPNNIGPEPSSDIPDNAVYYNSEPVYYDGEIVTYEV
jgi:hypothetical protein